MLKVILHKKGVPRVEIDQRARDARLKLERIERLLVPRAAVIVSWFRRVFGIFGFANPSENEPNPCAANSPGRSPSAP